MARGFLALCISLALLGGGLAHASVAHDHGHSHGAEESSVWTSLHSSLRHEDKKMLFMLVETASLATLAVLLVSGARQLSLKHACARASIRDPYARDALRRGIYRYRVFG